VIEMMGMRIRSIDYQLIITLLPLICVFASSYRYDACSVDAEHVSTSYLCWHCFLFVRTALSMYAGTVEESVDDSYLCYIVLSLLAFAYAQEAIIACNYHILRAFVSFIKATWSSICYQ